MNDEQSNKLKMFSAVQTLMALYNALWSSILAITEIMDVFAINIAAIVAKDQARAPGSEPVTEAKNAAKAYLIAKARKIARVALGYAQSINNSELIAIFDFSESEMNDARGYISNYMQKHF